MFVLGYPSSPMIPSNHLTYSLMLTGPPSMPKVLYWLLTVS